jgi:glycosyltransferase involved in cell wall biosynthesis
MTHSAVEPAGVARSQGEDQIPLVSVVIICYNHGRYLAEAIDSVLAQTLGDVEVIVVDDGSTDDTPAIAARYPTIRYLRQRNQGMSAARNSGFRASRGRYLSFLDADDRLLPEALIAGATCLREHPECAFVSGHYRMIGIDGEPIPTEPRPSVTSDHYRVLLERNYIGMHATVLFRREALESVSGFDRSMRACDDYEIYLRIARHSPVYSHDRTVAEYRWHGANTSLNFRLMLRSTLRPLRAQWRHVKGNLELEAAYRMGVLHWQRYYGRPLLAETLTRLREPEKWLSAALGLGTLLRHYPRGLWDRLVDKVVPAGGRRGRP